MDPSFLHIIAQVTLGNFDPFTYKQADTGYALSQMRM